MATQQRNDVRHSTEHLDSGSLPLIALDQTYICFDVEQPADAHQQLTVSRGRATFGSKKSVAWRIRTNAPTRYYVNPNSGVLNAKNPTATTTIELAGNRYNPHHKIVVQAIELEKDETPQAAWKSERAKSVDFVQTVGLELSTTVLNLDRLNQIGSAQLERKSPSLTSVLEQITTHGIERYKELQAIEAMLSYDTEQAQASLKRVQLLKESLDKTLQGRKETVKELRSKMAEKELELEKLQKRITAQEATLITMQPRQNPNNSACNIM
ncbi:Protein W08E3.4 [Aphelenchoides avenae]|nr:Protein W08E3.4 [Aphelenchus avenae]